MQRYPGAERASEECGGAGVRRVAFSLATLPLRLRTLSLPTRRGGSRKSPLVPASPRLLSHLLLEPLCFFSRTHALTSSSAPRELPLSPRPRFRASPRPLPLPSRLVRVTNFGNLVGNIADGIGHFSSSENEIHVGGALFEEGEYLILSN